MKKDNPDNPKKTTSKVENNTKFTQIEHKILDMLINQRLSPKQIAIRRKTSRQAVYKIIKKLKNNGVINKHYNEVVNPRCAMQSHPIRLHGQEFNINLLFKDHRYKEIRNKASFIYIDGNRIHLYKNSIEIYAGQSFYADTAQKATAKSMEYWSRFFMVLENRLKINIVKPHSMNIRLVKHHYAETGNEYAQECEKRGYKISVYTTDDGKLWFTIDNSFNLHEAETQHHETAKGDMETVQRHFNDLRDNKPPTLSEIMSVLNEIVKINKETASGLNALISYMQIPEETLNGHKPSYFG